MELSLLQWLLVVAEAFPPAVAVPPGSTHPYFYLLWRVSPSRILISRYGVSRRGNRGSWQRISIWGSPLGSASYQLCRQTSYSGQPEALGQSQEGEAQDTKETSQPATAAAWAVGEGLLAGWAAGPVAGVLVSSVAAAAALVQEGGITLTSTSASSWSTPSLPAAAAGDDHVVWGGASQERLPREGGQQLVPPMGSWGQQEAELWRWVQGGCWLGVRKLGAAIISAL